MAITINSPRAARIGPGYSIPYTISAGPIPVTDFVTVWVDDPAVGGGTGLVYGQDNPGGLLVGLVTMGIGPESPGSVGAMWLYIAPGALVTVTITQFHTGFVQVAQTIYNDYLWDPTGAAYLLNARLFGLVGSAADLSDIRDAVIPTYSHA